MKLHSLSPTAIIYRCLYIVCLFDLGLVCHTNMTDNFILKIFGRGPNFFP